MKGTVLFIFLLSITASLLIGFNFGKKFNPNLKLVLPAPTIIVTPSLMPAPTINLDNITSSVSASFNDKSCGISLRFPAPFKIDKNETAKSTIITNPGNSNDIIAVACLNNIPKPPLPEDKIEDIKLGGVIAKLYHDASSKDGSPRDEVIVSHPTNGMEVIIAGYGKTFNAILASFKFI